jgi:hypothetical protein
METIDDTSRRIAPGQSFFFELVGVWRSACWLAGENLIVLDNGLKVLKSSK